MAIQVRVSITLFSKLHDESLRRLSNHICDKHYQLLLNKLPTPTPTYTHTPMCVPAYREYTHTTYTHANVIQYI